MNWDEGLLEEKQIIAASHIGTHARLLAGPGTGKTTTIARRVAYLIKEEQIDPEEILVLTFTRAAAYELRSKIAKFFGENDPQPRVSTLHSFALRQLLRNSNKINAFPQPIRIADDWEEDNIICNDIKAMLNNTLKDVQEKFKLLSADWQKLSVDDVGWEQQFPDPNFIGVWRNHRTVYGYTLRSELVYQLKKALEQISDFSLESNYSFLIVDEYQDLNKCDLEVIYELRNKQIEIFGAGDDDQSIYGFRYAYPEGIREFNQEFEPSSLLELETCFRCDRKIIEIATFIADLDSNRLKKPLIPLNDAEDGEVHIVRFDNEEREAIGVAKICKELINNNSYKPDDILILMRSDMNSAFSRVIRGALTEENIPAASRSKESPLDSDEGRILISLLRLLVNKKDNLALRTIMMKRTNRIGKRSFDAIYELAKASNSTFAEAAYLIKERPEIIPRLGGIISKELDDIIALIDKHGQKFAQPSVIIDIDTFNNLLSEVVKDLISDVADRSEITSYFTNIIQGMTVYTLDDLIRTISASMEAVEQELEPDKVNILTMHTAKGLTAKAVIIIAAEDEYIPGKQTGVEKEDERRLLYVSLSRAKHFLALTYCNRRIGRQKYTGRTSGKTRRTLTSFLRDLPIRPIDGEAIIQQLGR
jgi:DNA helicase-2/ATP-dependent DNA helicase PcrA